MEQKGVCMKNSIKLFGITALAAVIGFSFAALSLTGCDNGGGGAHTHSYSTTWSKNATQHWRECSCGDKADVANHTGDPCTVCGYSGSSSGDPTSATYTGYDGEGKEYKLIISKGANSPGTPGGDNGNRDSRIVNAANDAWVDSYPAGNRDGFIFKADGACQLIDDYSDTTPGVFAVYGAAGTWTTSGNNNLTIAFGAGVGESVTYSYTVTGTTLTLTYNGKSEVYTKTQVTVSGRSVVSPAPAGAPGNKASGKIKRMAVDLSSPADGKAAGRAAYAPQSGDKFSLTVKNVSGATAGTSTGTVDNISGDTYTLDNGGKKFTAKIKGLVIEEIPDAIPLDGGGTLPAPVSLTADKPEPGPGPGPGPDPGGWTWTAVSNNTFSIETIVYGGGKFVAGGGRNQMVYSSDGVTWTAVADSTFTEPSSNRVDDIAYGGGKFVAVAYKGQAAYSSDGITWTAVTQNLYNDIFLSGLGIYAIAYGGNKFVFGGFRGQMGYSTDGITWTAVEDSKFGRSAINAIAYGNNRFVASGDLLGENSMMAYSADGITWTAVANSTFPTDGYIWTITYGADKFVAGGSGGKMAYSTDGASWTSVADSTFGTSGGRILSIAYGNGRFVAVGGDGKMAYSADGITWTASSLESIFGRTEIRAVAYGGGRFVAVGQRGIIAYADW